MVAVKFPSSTGKMTEIRLGERWQGCTPLGQYQNGGRGHSPDSVQVVREASLADVQGIERDKEGVATIRTIKTYTKGRGKGESENPLLQIGAASP